MLLEVLVAPAVRPGKEYQTTIPRRASVRPEGRGNYLDSLLVHFLAG